MDWTVVAGAIAVVIGAIVTAYVAIQKEKRESLEREKKLDMETKEKQLQLDQLREESDFKKRKSQAEIDFEEDERLAQQREHFMIQVQEHYQRIIKEDKEEAKSAMILVNERLEAQKKENDKRRDEHVECQQKFALLEQKHERQEEICVALRQENADLRNRVTALEKMKGLIQ